MVNKMVIAGSDNVTAKQLKELMNQIDQGVINGLIIQNLLDNAKMFSLKPLDLRLRLPHLVLFLKNKGEFYLLKKPLFQSDLILPLGLFKEWKDLIMHSVDCTRMYVKSLDVKRFKSYIQYFEECWQKFDNVQDDTQLIEAVAFLAISIINQ